MIKITENIAIHEEQIKYQYVRASGPGGQHVNKTSTAVILQYDVTNHNYPDWFMAQLRKDCGGLLSKEGLVRLKAQKYRSQARNKTDALNRLIQLFNKSSIRPKHRKKTQTPQRAVEKRISSKKKLSEKKKLRQQPNLEE